MVLQGLLIRLPRCDKSGYYLCAQCLCTLKKKLTIMMVKQITASTISPPISPIELPLEIPKMIAVRGTSMQIETIARANRCPADAELLVYCCPSFCPDSPPRASSNPGPGP